MASNGNGKVKTFIQFKKSLNLDNAYKYCLNLCLSNGNRKATKNKKCMQPGQRQQSSSDDTIFRDTILALERSPVLSRSLSRHLN